MKKTLIIVAIILLAIAAKNMEAIKAVMKGDGTATNGTHEIVYIEEDDIKLDKKEIEFKVHATESDFRASNDWPNLQLKKVPVITIQGQNEEMNHGK